MDTNNDRATVILDDRIDQHLYIVERNRKDLSNVVIFPKPPKSAIQAPDEFHYIEPNREQRNMLALGFSGRMLIDKDLYSKSDPYLVIYRQSDAGEWIPIRTSETIKVKKKI